MIAENKMAGFEINFSFGIFSTDWKFEGALFWLLQHAFPA
jgi:hypothetical protein